MLFRSKMALDGRLLSNEKRRDGVLEKVIKKQDAEAVNAEAARCVLLVNVFHVFVGLKMIRWVPL